jgi:hypothetical protein
MVREKLEFKKYNQLEKRVQMPAVLEGAERGHHKV